MGMMRKVGISTFFVAIVVWSCLVSVRSQGDGINFDEGGASPEAVSLIAELVYSRVSNLTEILTEKVNDRFRFCIKDANSDWNDAFNFSSNLGFISSCIQTIKEDLTRRLCTAAEVELYFSSIFERGGKASFLKPNRNCNLTSWVNGCEPGWACRVPEFVDVDLKNSKDVPSRIVDCRPCCEGFFCPHGLTCMIPCPLGAYCPVAKLNKDTGICEPFNYQLPPGRPNHTCGGADVWADVGSSREVFCSAGSSCPTTVQKIPCSSGHYCRLGSTTEKKCFKLTTCESSASSQNIHAYGIMLLVAISTLLLIIYNCSDQVLTTRERRHAKSREAAAKSARETALARKRWKAAKDLAKKHAAGLHAQLSQSFSRKRNAWTAEPLKVFDHSGIEPDDEHLFPVSSDSVRASSSTEERKDDHNNFSEMIHEYDENTDNDDEFNAEIDNKNGVKHKSKGKQMHSSTQIFKYAYGQLEKEKAMQEKNKNFTFSGVISMATDTKIRTRPIIEVAFSDLTLTLKGKNKQLLRSVTGKLLPGRVSAVMGPSGAGKTTLLNALSGKTTACNITGLVLINGKEVSMRSYKKVTGFVPQDDIVHGNLTVEENLWFSAKCRLPANMPKPEKVLVVERVIESLGLQTLRDSLVGTVEKRGISGGQRKRVNVGLEMVMEPSLLILDEPTSGLDSSSSQLLLRALRREALEGVTICMVVHQPSYALFRMFDDLILLGKGGLTVYHGPVKKVEEYFASMGINVPERVNPPDHFIDILEGLVKPSASSNLSVKQLPVRWMLHNGYAIPLDMQQYVPGNDAAAVGESSSNPSDIPGPGPEQQSFAGELWQDMKWNAERKRDNIRHNFLTSKDMSNRKTPGVLRQYRYFLGRVGKQRLREARMQAVDFLILLLAGACLGALAKVNDESLGAQGYTYTVIAVSLLCMIAALRSFSLEKLHYWRESGAGMSSLAYFLSKDTIDLFNTLIKPLVYLSMFYFFNNPRSSFAENYIVLLCLVYCVTGVAYAFAILLQPGAAQLWSVLLPVVLTLIATQRNKGSFMKVLASLCYTKWALEAFVISNAARYGGVWLITRCGALMASDYDINDWVLCLSILIGYGVLFRIVAYLCLITFQKK